MLIVREHLHKEGEPKFPLMESLKAIQREETDIGILVFLSIFSLISRGR